MTQTLKELLYNARAFFSALDHIIGFFSIIQIKDFDNFVKNASIYTVIAPHFYFQRVV